MVDILLATYNGGQYLESQILSILGQSFKDWQLLIHDDGSCDDTVLIAEKYTMLDERIIVIKDGVRTGSAGKNFMHLLNYSTSEYIMFCDQDDIWFDNKLQLMHENIIHKKQDVPIVLYSMSYAWKPSKGIIGITFNTCPEDLKSFLFLNGGIQGCATMFNKLMRNEMLYYKGDISMHDHLLNLIGLAFGKVYYLKVPLMLYRQHDSNVTGETRVSSFSLKSVVKSIRVPVVDRKHYDTISKFLEIYKSKIIEDNIITIERYLRFYKKTKLQRLADVLRYRFSVKKSVFTLFVKMLIKPYM